TRSATSSRDGKVSSFSPPIRPSGGCRASKSSPCPDRARSQRQRFFEPRGNLGVSHAAEELGAPGQVVRALQARHSRARAVERLGEDGGGARLVARQASA